MRWLGIDLGERRIGVALSDPFEITAQAYTVYQRKNPTADFDFFQNLIEKQEVEGIVVGLPRNMNGTEGPMAEKVRAFGGKLAERSGIPVHYWDERLSTASAERLLIAADLSRQKRRQTIDQVAAAIILQNFLDFRNRGKNSNDDKSRE